MAVARLKDLEGGGGLVVPEQQAVSSAGTAPGLYLPRNGAQVVGKPRGRYLHRPTTD